MDILDLDMSLFFNDLLDIVVIGHTIFGHEKLDIFVMTRSEPSRKRFEPAGRSLEPAGMGLKPAGRGWMQSRRASELAGRS